MPPRTVSPRPKVATPSANRCAGPEQSYTAASAGPYAAMSVWGIKGRGNLGLAHNRPGEMSDDSSRIARAGPFTPKGSRDNLRLADVRQRRSERRATMAWSDLGERAFL